MSCSSVWDPLALPWLASSNGGARRFRSSEQSTSTLRRRADAGEVLELGRRCVKVTDSIGRTIRATKPDVAVLCTGSTLKRITRNSKKC